MLAEAVAPVSQSRIRFFACERDIEIDTGVEGRATAALAGTQLKPERNSADT
jgi:hypothetical protein